MEIIITRKKVKKFTIRIHNDGRITLTSPIRASKIEIDNAIKSFLPFINSRYDKVVDKRLTYNVLNNNSIYILSSEYKFNISLSNKNNCFIEGNYLYIETKSLDKEYIEKLVDKYLDTLRIPLYNEIMDKYLSITNETINKLEIKKLKASYGRCNYTKRIIVLSKSLIHLDIKFIESVCLHEIAHLKFPNHSKSFYNYIKLYMSDYDERRKNGK